MLAVLWSRGPMLLQRERVFLAARAALLSMGAVIYLWVLKIVC